MSTNNITKSSMSVTKHGLPTLSESDEGSSNTGSETIICNSKGEKKQVTYQPRKGYTPNATHSIFVAHVGDIKIYAHLHKGDMSITIHKLIDMETTEGDTICAVETIDTYAEEKWYTEPDPCLEEAIRTIMEVCTMISQNHPSIKK